MLKDALSSIVTQANNDVEIIVVDGASTDNTEFVVKKYKGGFNSLNYFKLTQNGGIDQDYCKTVEYAKGDYCWFMSDDDIIKPGAIITVLNCISNKYDLIIVNTESRNINLSKVIIKKNLNILSDKIYHPDDFRSLFVETARHLSYIASIIIKRSVWNERLKEEYWGSLFTHVGVIFQKPLSADTLLVERPLIAVRRGNVSWTSNIFGIWLFKWPQIIWSFSAFTDSDKQIITRRYPWKKITVLLKFRGSCCYFKNDYDRWIKDSNCNVRFKMMARLITVLPIPLISLLLLIYLVIFKKRSKGSIYEIIMHPFYRKIFQFLT
jgi:glycosyltransferase involved in cell wall biosynthesis